MAFLSQPQAMDYLPAYLQIPFSDLRRIAPSSVVDMVVQYHTNNPGRYPDPTYDSYYMNHAPTSSVQWNIHQEQLYLNMLGHAARNSYPVYYSTINPMHTTSFLNPHAAHFQEIDHHLIIDDFDLVEEFEDWEWFSDDDVQETATVPDYIVDQNRSQDDERYKDLKTRRSREEDQIQDNICVVCHDGLYQSQNDDETIATLNCGHEYHIHCIKRWLQQKNVCPLCNATALPQE